MTELEKFASKYVDEKPDTDGFYDAFIEGYNLALRTHDVVWRRKQLPTDIEIRKMVGDQIDGGLYKQKIKWFEENLIIGAKIKIGKEYSKEYGFTEGEIIELIEGHFEHDNGLYTEDQTAPSIWDEKQKDFESIYHLFGNEFEKFLDCEVVS